MTSPEFWECEYVSPRRSRCEFCLKLTSSGLWECKHTNPRHKDVGLDDYSIEISTCRRRWMVVESALRAIKRHNDIESSMRVHWEPKFSLSDWTLFEYSTPSCIFVVGKFPWSPLRVYHCCRNTSTRRFWSVKELRQEALERGKDFRDTTTEHRSGLQNTLYFYKL